MPGEQMALMQLLHRYQILLFNQLQSDGPFNKILLPAIKLFFKVVIVNFITIELLLSGLI